MNPLKYLPASGFTIDPKALRKKWWGVSVWTAGGLPAESIAPREQKTKRFTAESAEDAEKI